MRTCSRCSSALDTHEDAVCGSCELLYSCPECGAYYAELAGYNPQLHYACDKCLGGLYARHPAARRSADILFAVIRESELRFSILGRLLPTWFEFLQNLHRLIYSTLVRQVMDEELDMHGAGS